MSIKSQSILYKTCKADIYFGDRVNPISISKLSLKRYKGPKSFDYTFIDFQDSFKNQIKSSINSLNRIYKSQNDLRVIGLTDSKILDSIERITEIANMPIEKTRREGFDYVYRKHLANICSSVFRIIKKDNSEVIVPLRGGALVAGLAPIKKEKIIAIDCKRVPLKGSIGRMGFGMRLYYDSIKRGDRLSRKLKDIEGKVRILEVCMASGLTTAGVLLNLYARKVKVDSVEVVAPVMAQQGYEFVKKVAEFTNIKTTFATGAIFYRLGNYYEDSADSLMTDDGRYVVGNATEILKSFLPKYIK